MAKFLQHAIKRPGKLTEESRESGRSKLQQAEHDSHSDNPSTRSRGFLGIRLLKGKLNGPVKHHSR